MQAGIFAKTYAGTDPATVLARAAADGYACVQYNLACSGLAPMPDHVSDAAIAEIDAARRATGVGIAALSATYNMIHPDPAQRQQGLERLKVSLQVAARLAIPVVTLCTGTRDGEDQWRHHPDNATPEAWRDLVEQMAAAAASADALGIRLGIEPEQANVVRDAEDAVRLMREVASPSLGIVLDPANLFERADAAEARDIVAHAIDRLGDRILMAHAKDRDASGAFVSAGRGVVDFRDIIARLSAIGFDGPVVTHGLSEAEAPDVCRFLTGLLS
ncbi:sugar phosphate isomerase/epimerase family protein [Allorhizobium taibaishanense]|uniref:Epimerase n=1 Tax=Allorhizobium taibaishanense TaxID=887144 RepID=A0A1Q9A3M6_9HYPH|nr:sugar phosphate isomerase/epimerase [Allorhizobium taibaishanense]MBB4006233.1 sugar phosphate isomerase/epimerase [Allorhizobium taibaishanense]OLP49215.1 epimerase [Allorhizobium taibaishanense]